MIKRIYIYKKSTLIKSMTNIIFKFYTLFNKNIFIAYIDQYRHIIWKYKKNVAKRD